MSSTPGGLSQLLLHADGQGHVEMSFLHVGLHLSGHVEALLHVGLHFLGQVEPSLFHVGLHLPGLVGLFQYLDIRS